MRILGMGTPIYIAPVSQKLTNRPIFGSITRHVPVTGGASFMNVAFLKPPIGGILGLEMLTFVEPLGPISIAGGLEADGHTCRIFDLRLDGEEPGMELCRRFNPQVV